VPKLGELVAALERRYDPRWAEPWDAVGLVCGDPDAAVDKVHFAVDPVAATADEAIASGAQLLVTHHPLYLRGTTTVAATDAKGRLVHRLISNGVALYVAHTNADVADPGVSDALAEAIAVQGVEPLDPRPGEPQDKLVTFVPVDGHPRNATPGHASLWAPIAVIDHHEIGQGTGADDDERMTFHDESLR